MMDTTMTEEVKIRILNNTELLTMLLTAICDAEKADTKLNDPKTLAECLKINEGYRRVKEYLPTEEIDHKAYMRTHKELKKIDFLSIAKDLIKLASMATRKDSTDD